MTIIVCYHFGTYRNFKEHYQNFIKEVMQMEFPDAIWRFNKNPKKKE